MDVDLAEPGAAWDIFHTVKMQNPGAFFVLLREKTPHEILAAWPHGPGGWIPLHPPFPMDVLQVFLKSLEDRKAVYFRGEPAAAAGPVRELLDALKKGKPQELSSLEQVLESLTKDPKTLVLLHAKSADMPLAVTLRRIYQCNKDAKTVIFFDDDLETVTRSAVREGGWAAVPLSRGASFLLDQIREAVERPSLAKQGAERLLVVDDEPALLDLMTDRLSEDGYQVEGAASGKEALAVMKSKEFHAALVDYQLGDTTGLALAKEFRQLDPDIPIILMTAHASLDMAVKAIQADVYDYLIKPVDQNHLRRSLNKALEKRRLALEVKMLVADLQKANLQLNRLSDLKSKFLSIVTHDLRTPLTSIKGYAQVLTMSTDIPEDQKGGFLKVIIKEADHLSTLISDLMDFVSIEAGKLRVQKESVQLSDILKDMKDRMEPLAAQRKIRFSVEAPGTPLPALEADSRRIEQVLTNLIGNAFKHTPEDGKVTLSAEIAGPFIRLQVADTGEGIPPGDIRHIFEQFYQVESHTSKKEGIGLGLSIAREIVQAHGGEIGVHSAGVGQGSQFWFTLPIPQTKESPPNNP